MNKSLFEYVVSLGDSPLIFGQRLGEWCGHSPALELDMAITNFSLDYFGQAQFFLDYASEIEGQGRSADDLAFLRDCLQFRNYLLVEQPNADWGRTIVRLYMMSAYYKLFYAALKSSKDEKLAAIAEKAEKEVSYHFRFAEDWFVRLGCGTDVSANYIQTGLDDLWRFSGELFHNSAGEQELIDNEIAIDVATLEDDWQTTMKDMIAHCRLKLPEVSRMTIGRHQGHHSEHLGHLLSEMQFLQRAYPGAKW